MQSHFNWIGYLLNVDEHLVHVATALTAAGVLFALGAYARFALGTGEQAIIPARKFSVKGFFELLTETTYNLSELVIGHDGYKYVPLAAAIFLYVFINNMLGMIPGMTPASENMNMSFAVGMFSFLYYNYVGVKQDGLKYFAHFLGPVWWLAWLILPIELISHAFRPLTLGIRLHGNISADHTVLAVFHQLSPIGLPVPFYMMGLIVSLIQAFVFALLTLVYVMLAKAHDH